MWAFASNHVTAVWVSASSPTALPICEVLGSFPPSGSCGLTQQRASEHGMHWSVTQGSLSVQCGGPIPHPATFS